MELFHAFVLKAWICSGLRDRRPRIGRENLGGVPPKRHHDLASAEMQSERGGWKMKIRIVAAADTDGQTKEGASK